MPGTTSNIPGYLGIEGTGEGGNSEQSKFDLTVDYLVNKEVRMEDLPPGAIKRLSAAVAISTEVWDENTKTAVEQLVASAIGASPLLLLAAKEVPAQFGGEPGVLVGAANDPVMAGAGLDRAGRFGTLIGHGEGSGIGGAAEIGRPPSGVKARATVRCRQRHWGKDGGG